MRKIASIISIACFLLAVSTGCKKQADFLADAGSGSAEAVGFGEDNSSATSVTVEASTAQLDQPINVYLSSTKTYGSAISVTIDTSSAVVDDYNTANGTAYEVMPSDVYTLPTGVSIPSNSKEGPANIKVDIQALLGYGTAFALGVKITQVSGGPGNIMIEHSKHVLVVQVKNKWDGRYMMTGTMVDVTNAALTGPYPFEVNLETNDGTSVIMFNSKGSGSFQDYYHPILSSGAASVYGAFDPIFIIDPATGKITDVVNAYGQPASNSRYAGLDPTGLNQVNADGSIDVKYFMYQPSVVTTAPYIRTTFDEHFEYLGPR
ncbi:MAG: DUF1735 domain-containing protein [Bacteroidota bacterium]